MADNKMPFVTSKALKRTPATKENKDRIKYMDSHEFSFKFDKVTGKFVSVIECESDWSQLNIKLEIVSTFGQVVCYLR